MTTRYETPEMAALWNEEAKFRSWLLVEKTVASVQAELGIIPKPAARAIQRASFRIKEIDEFEKVTNHDVIAFLEAVREKLGRESRWLHFGMTSYDLVDTALTLIILEATDIVLWEISRLAHVLKKLAARYRRTPQMGRTHGMFAQPVTFGFKIASWYQEIRRAKKRLEISKDEIAYGKISGAVGSYTILPPMVEKKVMQRLGLKAEPVSTQIIPRDRLAYFFSSLVLYTCGIDRIMTEIRNLSRSEIAEVSEPFTRGQKGSSAMPHKQNPITCERVCGLVKVMRGYLVPVYENINLWHERDLTNSSVERIVIADAFYLTHYITTKTRWVLENLNVYPMKMMENIKESRSVYASQQLMNRLIEKGMSRKKAYDLVQALSFQALKDRKDLKGIAARHTKVKQYLNSRELDRVFDLKWFLRNITGK